MTADTGRDWLGNPDRLVNEREAADVLCYSVRALQNWRHRGGGPKFVKVSARFVRYRVRDLLDWIDARTVHSTSQPPSRNTESEDREDESSSQRL